MSRENRPQIPLPARRKHRTHCARGHEISGYNARPIGNRPDSVTCRACHVSNLWARRNNLFQDNPRVIEHAAALYERYRDTAVIP